MNNKKVSIDDVISKINKVLDESGVLPVEVYADKLQGVQADQLPPYVADIEEDLFEKMCDNFKRLNGTEPSDEIVSCIRFIAQAEAVRRHVYRKLAMQRLDEFLDSHLDNAN